ncbi:MFS transporter [Saccharococcus caldoxylosilyticus]|uniref:MFS transporter n=1 Tax=Saccharococcus caldoxylosilyticus TaxID=81408 RepID=UPI001FCC7B4F|nr:MFS transporter [Parageobacillus caldoxylosilyticus]BDG34594.1 MFS transporter [Parageobacillus caldoxylosilyticus]BDG38367.1 MFS transporter [Parageobacillus caldoxylosilyticus]
MSSLYRDRQLYLLLVANLFSSVGTGITMTAVPWMLVQKPDGAMWFGYMSTAMTIIMFLLTPYVGMWIDQISRKVMLMFGEAIGLVIAAMFALYGMAEMKYHVWHLVFLFASGSLYYFLFYPTLFAFSQEVFHPDQYKMLNGIMEIQGQLATVISGGAASLLLTKVPLYWILWLDACTYAVAIICFFFIPYQRSFRNGKTYSFWTKMTEGYHYMKARPLLFWFLLASLMPFIGVMMTNYLHPIYIVDVLKEDSSVYGIQSMVYGIGAALAGAVVPLWLRKVGTEVSITITVFIYAMAMTMFLFVKNMWIFYVLVSLTAFGNAGTRVARSSLMMERIPNEKIGRVDGLFRALGFLIRSALLSVFTGLVSLQHVLIPYAVLSGLLIISGVLVLRTGESVKKEQVHLTSMG